jgi:hypothetical protein
LQPSASSSLKLHFNTNIFIAAALLFLAILWSAQIPHVGLLKQNIQIW